MKGERMAKRSSFGTIVRKRLSDITNSLPQSKYPIHVEKPWPNDSSAKEYIDHLLKENMGLMKLIEDKNKIIELSGAELQKMRINLQKMQLQNWNLAQRNSHILAELNLGREKLKTLQHEILCKDGLLKVKNLELEGKAKMSNKNSSQEGTEAVGQHESDDENKPRNGHRRRPTRSQSLGPSTASQQVAEKETAENKRRCLRRQSTRFKSHQQEEHVENLFEITDAILPLGSSMTKQEVRDEIRAPRLENQELQRSSLGRPLRRAAEKVQSYKEVPLNVKMRRSE